MKKPTYLIVIAAFAVLTLTFIANTTNAQDPTAVDAKHYTVELENEYVRVLRVKYGANEKSVMHRHPEGVAISLTAMKGKFSLADGKSENRTFKAGDVRWTAAETHLPENTSGKPFEVVLVELKGGGGSSVAAADDAVKVDGKHHKLNFENDRVRVVRGTIGAREKTLMHGHPANVVIFLTDAKVRSTLPDGKTEEAEAKAGQVTWRGAVKHVSENVGDKPLEVIVVELKGN